MNETKHPIQSTTFWAMKIGILIVLINIYLKYSGNAPIELSSEELTAIATVACNVWVLYRRARPQKDLKL